FQAPALVLIYVASTGHIKGLEEPTRDGGPEFFGLAANANLGVSNGFRVAHSVDGVAARGWIAQRRQVGLQFFVFQSKRPLLRKTIGALFQSLRRAANGVPFLLGLRQFRLQFFQLVGRWRRKRAAERNQHRRIVIIQSAAAHLVAHTGAVV